MKSYKQDFSNRRNYDGVNQGVNRRYKSKTYKGRVYKKKSVPPAIRNYVNRTIQRNIETKFATFEYGLTYFNSTISTTGDILQILSGVPIGTEQYQRVGLKIKPVKIVVEGYVCCASYSIGSNIAARLLGVRLFCYRDKTTNAVQSGIYNYNLLNAGGDPEEWTGVPMDWNTAANTDLFEFYQDKKFIIQKPYGYVGPAAIEGDSAIGSMNETMWQPFKFVIEGKQLPATLQYDTDDSVLYPVNFNPRMAVGYCDLLNAAPDTVNTQVAMQYRATLYFKDA